MNNQPLPLNLLERLLPRLSSRRANNHLRAQLPVLAHIPLLLNLLVDQRVVMLEVGAQAFGLKGCPDGVLVHAVGLCGPDGELVGVQCELLLH